MPINITNQKVKFLMGDKNTLQNAAPDITPGQVYFAVDKNSRAEIYLDIQTDESSSSRIEVSPYATQMSVNTNFITDLSKDEIWGEFQFAGTPVEMGVQGVLPISNGGTNNTSYVANGLILYNGTNNKFQSAENLTYNEGILEIKAEDGGYKFKNYSIIDNTTDKFLELKKLKESENEEIEEISIASLNDTKIQLFGKDIFTKNLVNNNPFIEIKNINLITASKFSGDLIGNVTGIADEAITAYGTLAKDGNEPVQLNEGIFNLSIGNISDTTDYPCVIQYQKFNNADIETLGAFAPVDTATKMIPLKYIPHGARERLFILDTVAITTIIDKITKTDEANDNIAAAGDTLLIGEKMYYVRKQITFESEKTSITSIKDLIDKGYIAVYTAGTASNVEWTGVLNKANQYITYLQNGTTTNEGHPVLQYKTISSDGYEDKDFIDISLDALSLSKGGTVEGTTIIKANTTIGDEDSSQVFKTYGSGEFTSTLSVGGATTLGASTNRVPLTVYGNSTFNGNSVFTGNVSLGASNDSKYSSDTEADLVVNGGASIGSRLSARDILIDDGTLSKGCYLEFDSTNEILKFVFK